MKKITQIKSIANPSVWFVTMILGMVSCQSHKPSQLNSHYQFLSAIDTSDQNFHYPDLVFIPDAARINYAVSLEDKNFPEIKDVDLLFERYETTDALSFILEASKDHEMIILNEAHHRPSHRMFALKLLKGLKANGYKNLFVEGLTNSAHFPLKDYPTPKNGYYINEPTYAGFIKEAIQLDFNIFPYEAHQKSGKEREIEQAKNIVKFLETHPEGKTFIYCGYSHNNEGDMGSWGKSMAGRLKEYLHVDPYTINQFYYNNITTIKGLKPVVLIDSLKNAYQLPGRFDLFVFHPQYWSSDSKPYWKMKESDQLIPIDFIPKDSAYPIIAAAFKNKEEQKNGIPLDIVEIIDQDEPKWLCVPKSGNYEVVLFDANRKRIKTNKQL